MVGFASSVLFYKKFCSAKQSYAHSSKILTIQQGQPRGVSSGGNPRQASTGFNSGSLMAGISTTVWTWCIQST